jgi:hypothetical protein
MDLQHVTDDNTHLKNPTAGRQKKQKERDEIAN